METLKFSNTRKNRHEIPDEAKTTLSRAVEAEAETLKSNAHDHKDGIKRKPYRKLIPADAESIRKLLEGPSDKQHRTLFVAPTPPNTEISDVKGVFYLYGPITNVIIQRERNCAFITFQRREDAELAAHAVANGDAGNLIKGQVKIRGDECRLEWAQPST